MEQLADLYATNPIWVWLAIGALLLAIEAGTGSGWLLWAAVSAAVVGVASLAGIEPAVQIALFAILTIVTTLGSRKLIKKVQGEGGDINDQTERLIGKVGRAASPFVEGHGRAFVDGSEWIADLEGASDLAQGSKVVVTAVAGARLKVKSA